MNKEKKKSKLFLVRYADDICEWARKRNLCQLSIPFSPVLARSHEGRTPSTPGHRGATFKKKLLRFNKPVKKCVPPC